MKTTKSKKGEVSAASMMIVMMDLLIRRPILRQAELEEEIKRRLGHEFTAADHVPIRVFDTTRPKWLNNLDWAKSVATKKCLIATRKKKGTTFIVLLAHDENHRNWKSWALGGHKKTNMTKRCKCGNVCPLAAAQCELCGHVFPTPTEKRFVVPK